MADSVWNKVRASSVWLAARCLVALIGLAVGAPPAALADPLPVAKLDRKEPVDFQRDLLPVFRKKCLACHNASDAEGDLVLESAARVKQGGGSGAVVVPGKPAESPLFLLARHADEPVMPPEDNDVAAKNLTPEELALLERWIAEGAKGSKQAGSSGAIAWQPLPPGGGAIFTAAVDPSGRYAAAGRANQVTLYHLDARRMVIRLTDPSLIERGLYKQPGVAHLDYVQSLAFAPSGELLASGGYRTIKLWRRAAGRVERRHAGSGQAVTAWCVAPDRTVAFVGSAAGQVRRITLGKAGKPQSWSAHSGPLAAIAFSPASRKLATADKKGEVRIWDAEGKRIGQFKIEGTVRGLAWLPDDRLAVTGGKSVVLFASEGSDASAAWRVVSQLKGFTAATTGIEWNAARKEIIAGSLDGSVRIFRFPNGQLVRSMKHGGPVEALALRSDGLRLVSVSANKGCVLWDATNGRKLGALEGDLREQLALADREFAVKLAGVRVAAAKRDVDAAKNRRKAEEASKKKTDDDLKKATDEVAKKKKELAKPKAASDEAAGKLTDVKQRRAKAEADEKARSMELAAAQKAKQVAERELAASTKTLQAAQQAERKAKTARDAAQRAAAAKKDDKELAGRAAAAQKALDAAVAARKKNEMARAAAQQKLQQAAARAKTLLAARQKLQAELKKLAAEQKSAEANAKKAAEVLAKAESALATAERNLESAKRTAERGAKLLEQVGAEVVQAEQRLKQLEAAAKVAGEALEQFKKSVPATRPKWVSVAFTPGGATLVAGSHDGRVVVCDAESLKPLEQFAMKDSLPVRVAAVSDERYVAVASPNGELVERPLFAPWELVRTIGNPDDPSMLLDRVTALAFDPTGTKLASGSGDPSRSGQLRLWDVEHGTLLRDIPQPHSDMVLDVAFSREGDRLASSAADRFVKVFDVATGKLLRSFEGHTGHVLGITWSGDSRLLASSGADQVVKIWDATTGDQKRTISGFKKEATDVLFVGLSNQILITAGDPVVQIRRSDNGGVVRSFSGATDYVYAGGVDRAGRYIVAGSHDGVLRVWTPNGKAVASFDK